MAVQNLRSRAGGNQLRHPIPAGGDERGAEREELGTALARASRLRNLSAALRHLFEQNFWLSFGGVNTVPHMGQTHPVRA